ncbi:MAG TPA: MBL fold metallo-hydrolase [Candidatus Nanoarchaeia archaeon]|nr:MBL fold metallo-hydrolase [Candidatus Nanoarchaeia archaeon]
MSKSKISFYGAAGTVTGSNFLFDIDGAGKILIDCGLFQGSPQAYSINLRPFTFDPSAVQTLLVTHAHIDHIGRIPKLVRDGFSGTIFSTPQTKEIASIMFDDALKIMEEEMRRSGTKEAMYTRADVSRALTLWDSHKYHEPFEPIPSVRVEFLDAGHIIGSSMIKLTRNGRTIIFTGDTGNSPSPIIADCEPVTDANYLVIDSTYGDRTHESREEAEQKFAAVVAECVKDRRTLLIPVFSLERAHIILYALNDLVESGMIPQVPVYLDSPLASRLLPIYANSIDLFNEKAKAQIRKGDDIFSFPKLKIVQNSLESSSIDKAPNPKIIIAGSGMSVGGRIPAHEIALLPSRSTTLLITGYQAAGTIGRQLEEGAKLVHIHNQPVEVGAKIKSIEGFSAHKDSNALLELIDTAKETLEQVFVVHGEPKAAFFLIQRIKDYLGLRALAPEKERVYEINF